MFCFMAYYQMELIYTYLYVLIHSVVQIETWMMDADAAA